MNAYIELIHELIQLSENVIHQYYQKNFSISRKEDLSPVTQADKECEKVMREAILRAFPDHSIIGEEFPDHEGKSPFKWVLDPIDGTKSFIHGVPLFGTLIALLKEDEPFIGVIHNPILKETYLGVEGQTSLKNGNPIKIDPITKLSDATMLVTDFLDVEKYQKMDGFLNLAKQCRLLRTWGDCSMYGLLSRGDAHIVMDPVMNYWDIQALIPIVKGAGGIVTDWQGNAPQKATSLLATVPALHEQVLEQLN